MYECIDALQGYRGIHGEVERQRFGGVTAGGVNNAMHSVCPTGGVDKAKHPTSGISPNKTLIEAQVPWLERAVHAYTAYITQYTAHRTPHTAALHHCTTAADAGGNKSTNPSAQGNLAFLTFFGLQ